MCRSHLHRVGNGANRKARRMNYGPPVKAGRLCLDERLRRGAAPATPHDSPADTQAEHAARSRKEQQE